MTIGSLPAQSLQRIAPYVERLAGREIPPENPNAPLTEDQIALRVIRREVMSHNPLATAADAEHFRSVLSDFRQQRIANGESLTGAFGFNNNVASPINSQQDMLNFSHNANLDMLAQLMEAITAMRATDPQQINNSGGLNITI